MSFSYKVDENGDLDTRNGSQSDDSSNVVMSTEKAEERPQSAWQMVRSHPALVWWAFFFAMSAVGW
jgi:hypothetical protein